MWQREQLRQTIISTGSVGALFGILPVLGLLAFRSEYQRFPSCSRSLVAQVFDAGLLFFGSVLFCIVVFGLLPMALQYCFIRVVRRWTGGA